MLAIAVKMLFGDRTKYTILVLGIAFATLLINQQGAIFLGLLVRATGPLQNVHQPDLWVADPGVRFIAEYRPLSDQKLNRVRSVPGVSWAEPLINNWAVVELPDGRFEKVNIIGMPRTSMVGRPPEIIAGRIDDLRAPGAVMIEESSLERLGHVKIGDTLRLNDHRAVVVGFCKAKKGFESNLLMYATYDNVLEFTPAQRRNISYIVVKCQSAEDIPAVQRGINELGDVRAFTRDQFALRTIDFILRETGIGVNFGITIVLGFIVGVLLSAAVFYQFVTENLRQFAVLKALGLTGRRLTVMVLVQALIVGLIGFGVGVGGASVFTIATRKASAELDAMLPWQLLAVSLAAMLVCILLASVLSLRRVLRVPPGLVFSG
ncbi:MAG: putative ABC transporter permease [Phycisphaerales bacterium]|nr:putative ABC transporter permease [Phycisphaerales bacterium]